MCDKYKFAANCLQVIASLLATEQALELDLFFFPLLALAVEATVVAAKDTFWDRRCGKGKRILWLFFIIAE